MCNLVPLLRQSSRPRVLSIVNGGREKALHEPEIGLKQRCSLVSVINHTTTMTSLAFEHLAETDSSFTFLHSYRGIVRTDIFARLTPPESSDIFWRITLSLIRGLVAMLMLCVGIPVEECGERQAFLLTSDKFGPGAWRIDSSSEQASRSGVLERYREGSCAERIWEHTMRVFDTALAVGSEIVPK